MSSPVLHLTLELDFTVKYDQLTDEQLKELVIGALLEISKRGLVE